ncbi:hypothetical protein KCU64_g12332, partial [Aureobasidium melanogenum]
MALMFKKVPKTDLRTTSPATTNSNRGGAGGRRSLFTRRPGRQKLTGLFADGIWYCDCEPRLPAEHFQVKKESANKGRWFYTCQNGEGRRCGFFMWNEDAHPREAAALLNNSTTEPKNSPDKPLSPVHPSSQTMQSSSTTTSTLSQPNAAKRPFSETGLDDADTDHDSFPWYLSGQEEAQLLAAPETPRKAVKFDGLATPATSTHRRLPWLDRSAQSPFTIAAKATSSKPSSLPQHSTSSKSVVAQHGALTPQVTPSPSRFHDPSADTSSFRSTLNQDVFAALSDSSVTLSANLTAKLRDVLTRHELRTQGVIKGREITRLALKARDAKITELQATIASLEAERDVDHARITRLEWEKDMLARNHDFDTEL